MTTEQAAAVFRRAAEIDQRGNANGRSSLDLAALEQAGVEAGISRDAIHQALAEVRAGGVLPVVRRPDAVVARTLNMTAKELDHEVEHFMRRQRFRVLRRLDDRTIWVRDRSMGANIIRMVDFNQRIVLREVNQVTTCVVEVPSERRAHVRFDLDLTPVRRGWYSVPWVAGAVGAAGVSVAATLGTPLELIAAAPGAVALAGGAFAGARMGFRSSVRRSALGIERFLDLLQHGR